MIWKYPINVSVLDDMTKHTMSGHLGIKFEAHGPDWLEASMPVDARTRQPAGLLHGGASAVLAEELGSIASMLCLDDHQNQTVVGIELNSSHLRSARDGRVTGRVSPIKTGRTTHIWHIEIRDEKDRLVNVSRLTTMVISKN